MNIKKIRSKCKKKTIILYIILFVVISTFNPFVHSNPINPWWNIDWSFRKQITIDYTKVIDDLVDFPVFIHITDPDFTLKSQENGNDIVFTDLLGVVLDYEIEKYDSDTGDLVAWVNIPLLSSIESTIFYVYYGNPSFPGQGNSEATWDSSYLAVHHLNEQSGNLSDSTSHHNDGAIYGNLNQNISGYLDGADYFDGVDDYVMLPQIFSGEDHFTLQAWIYAEPNARYFISQWNNNHGSFLQVGATPDHIEWYIDGTSLGFYSITLNAWYHVVASYDGVTARLYVNGGTPVSKVCGNPSWPAESLLISNRITGGRLFHGLIDEVRLSNIARSTAWIQTEYNNQVDPSSYFSVGDEESFSVELDVINENPLNGATDIPITLSNLQFSVVNNQNDSMSYTVTTVPDIIGGLQSGTNVSSGATIDIPVLVSPLFYNLLYTWHVNVTNGVEWTNKTFCFTTCQNIAPVIINVYPHNQNATYNPRLSVSISDENNDLLNVSFNTNASGAWHTLGTYSGYNGNFYHDDVGMDVKGQKYYWSINITDGIIWVNDTYHFIAQPFILSWSFDIQTATTNVGPLAADVNSDGIYEIFPFGDNKIFCLNGTTGEVIWSYFNYYIGEHSQAEIGDLNNDGIFEIVISAAVRTIALHANNGTVYWNVNAESQNKNIIIVDLDGNKYPYVFIACEDVDQGLNGTGRLRKLRGTDGAILAETFAWRPCYGSLSLADLDNDGTFEVFMTDRSYTYYPGEPGRGIQCFDAETLQLLWYQDSMTCSSHSAALVDINNDGVLDVVVLNQITNAGIYVIDGATWDKMNGKYQQSISGLSAHSQFSIHDIDFDGNVELITCSSGPAIVWDLGLWDLDATLANAFEPAMMGNVIGDEKHEIILADNKNSNGKIYIYNKSYQLLETIYKNNTIANVLVQDVDNDGRNELILMANGVFTMYKTSAKAEAKKPRTTSGYYSERRTGVASYIPPPGAPQPIIKAVTPVNNSQDVNINPIFGAHVIDYHYDLMNITISTNASGDWEDVVSYTGVGNGWYNITLSTMNQQQTTYFWRITAVDLYSDNLTTIETFQFTTSTPPEISNITTTPSVINSGEQLNISAHVTDNDHLNTVAVQITNPNGTTTNSSLIALNTSWVVLAYDSFEDGWGNYMSGGLYCDRPYNPTYSYNGNRAARLRHYRGMESSLLLAESIDGVSPRYTSLKVDFWFYTRNFGSLENFWVKYWDGQHWRIVDNYIKPGQLGHLPGDKPFNNNGFYHGVTYINASQYPFHTDMKIRFECDASSSSDEVYIDHVYINATTEAAQEFYVNTSFIKTGIYHYIIIAQDRSGNSITSEEYTFCVGNKYQVSLQAGWNLISLPISESYEKDNLIIVHMGVMYSWHDAVVNTMVNTLIYYWDVDQQIYASAYTIHPGKGYWIYANQSCNLTIYSNTSEPNQTINLSTTWNLIGITFNTSIGKQNITIFYNNLTYSWKDAVNNSIVADFLFGWDSENQIYHLNTDTLYQGAGYWLYAFKPCMLHYNNR